MRSSLLLCATACQLVSGVLTAQTALVRTLEVENGSFARDSSPLSLTLPVDEERGTAAFFGQPSAELWLEGKRLELAVQVDLLAEALQLHWVHPPLEEGETQRLQLRLQRAEVSESAASPALDRRGNWRDLLVRDQPILRYMYGYDSERREETYKVFHHVFDFSGANFLTKGPGGTYSHHRGLFLGFNQIRIGDESLDFWHCSNGLRIEHHNFLEQTNGSVCGSSSALINWLDGSGKPMVEELRRVRAWPLSSSRRLLDFDFGLRALAGDLILAGDAQHAGFQFRSRESGDEENDLKVSYLRSDAAQDRGNDVWTDCDWAAARFDLDGRRYAVMHMDADTNPRPNRYSTREYGRFGSTFDAKVAGGTLKLRYRILIIDVDAEGEPSPEYLERQYRDFVEPLRLRLLPN